MAAAHSDLTAASGSGSHRRSAATHESKSRESIGQRRGPSRHGPKETPCPRGRATTPVRVRLAWADACASC
jgi:hypothetical protein